LKKYSPPIKGVTSTS